MSRTMQYWLAFLAVFLLIQFLEMICGPEHCTYHGYKGVLL